MEAAAGAGRGVSLTQSPSRKEWRAVTEQSVRSSGNEGRDALDAVDFCSIEDGIMGVDDDILQERIHSLARQREELQQIEMALRAQMIVKSEIMEMRNSFDSRFQEQANVTARLQEQLHEREHLIHELERKMEEKERELQAVELDKKTAWAKEDLLREQNLELAKIRRERDSIEAERAHHMKQIHDLQEHIQDKERQLMELQEQHRVNQEDILVKDKQIQDAQAWITRAREIEAMFQAELQERTEQYNQLWLGCQRQFVEMERLHMQAMQQLQLELTGGKSGTYNTESSISHNTSSDGSQIGPNNGSHVETNGGGTPNGNSGGLSNGNSENSQTFVSSGNSSRQTNHVPSLPVTPNILGMPSYLPPGQVTSLHPYVMHQQGTNNSMPPHVPQSHVGHFHSVPAMASFQQWHNQQAVSEGPTSQNQYPPSQNEENPSRSEPNYSYEFSVNGPRLHPDYLNAHMSQGLDPNSRMSSSEEAQTLESIERSYFVGPEAHHNLQQISSQFHEVLRLQPLEQTGEIKSQENDGINMADNGPEHRDVIVEQISSFASPPSEAPVQVVHVAETAVNNTADAVLSEAFVSTGQTNLSSIGKLPETPLLDERALLACIVRTIPAGGKIRISSTLPNRLGKMLAPLHWHDYKRKYGKLDEFVASHPELFVIEEDFIQLREGAQGIIAATAAVAKVAAAAAASSPYSSFFPSVAVTPMYAGRVKKIPMESKPVRNSAEYTHSSAIQNVNGSGFSISGGLSNVKILSKSKDSLELNGSEVRPGEPVLVPAENGAHSDKSGLSNQQSKGPIQARAGAGFVGKQQGRTTSAQLASRR